MSLSLREYAEKMRAVIPTVEWVAYDGKTVKCYSCSNKPEYVRGVWAGKSLATLRVKREDVSLKGTGVYDHSGADYSMAIFGFEDSLQKLMKDKKGRDKHTTRRKGVIAYFADGSTVLFDTFTECKEFFGLATIGDVRRCIDLGLPLPDGSTTLDEAVDGEFMHQLFHE